MMRCPIRPMLAAAALLLTAACTSRSGRPAPAAATGRIIRITEQTLGTGGSDTIRFGHLYSGEIAVQQLQIVNETDRPIVLLEARTSCGCTSLEFDRQPIRAGENRQAELFFDSRGEWGWQLKRMDLQFAGAAAEFRIFVEADVE